MAEPAGSSKQDILKELQNASSTDQLEQIIKKLHVKIGVFGGRRFYLEGGPTVSMQEIIDTLKTRELAKKEKEGSIHHHVWTALKEKQVAGEQELTKAGVLKRILSAIRRLTHTVDRSTLIDTEISDSATRSFQKRLAAIPAWVDIQQEFSKNRENPYAEIQIKSGWDEEVVSESYSRQSEFENEVMSHAYSEEDYRTAVQKRNQLRNGIIAILKEIKPEELEFFLNAIIMSLAHDWKRDNPESNFYYPESNFYLLVMGCLPLGDSSFIKQVNKLMNKIIYADQSKFRAYFDLACLPQRQSEQEKSENKQLCKELIARGVIPELPEELDKFLERMGLWKNNEPLHY